MKAYYEDIASGITIYHGDCREILPQLPKVDLVLTDPPYGMNYESNHRIGGNPFGKIKGDTLFNCELVATLIAMANSAAYVFCRWDNLKDIPKPKSFIAWVKNNWSMGDLEHEYARQWEACAFYAKENHRWLNGRPQDVIMCDRVNPAGMVHPTEKPLHLMTRLLSQSWGETILDPFMGSGTTLRAAADLGRRAIGIEIEEKYCEIAAKRLSQKVLQFCDPEQPTPSAQQIEIYGPQTNRRNEA